MSAATETDNPLNEDDEEGNASPQVTENPMSSPTAGAALDAGPDSPGSEDAAGGSYVKSAIDFVLIMYCIVIVLVAWGSVEETATSQQIYCELDVPLASLDCGTKKCEPGFVARQTYAVAPADLADLEAWRNETSVLSVNASDTGLTAPSSTGDKSCHQLNREFEPVSANLKFGLSMVPFVIVFQGILSFKLSSRYVAPTALIVVSFIGLTLMRDTRHFNGDDLPSAAGKVILEIVDRLMWTIFDYAANVFTAFFLLRVLQIWGVVEALRIEFEQLAPTTNDRIALVGFAFAIMLAVVAPGGSNFVIAGAILIKMNLTGLEPDDPVRLMSNKKVGAMCLFGNALTSAFNLLGVCVNVLAEDLNDNEMEAYKSTPNLTLADDFSLSVKEGELEIGRMFSLLFCLFSTSAPMLMCILFSNKDGICAKIADVAPDGVMLFVVGFSYSVAQILVAGYVGRELPCMLGGIAGMASFVAYQKLSGKELPQKEEVEGEEKLGKGHWLPFILLLGILLLMNLIPAVKPFVTGKDTAAAAYLNIPVWEMKESGLSFSRKFAPIWHSAMITAFVALLTPFICTVRDIQEDRDETLHATGMGDNSFSDARSFNPEQYKRQLARMKNRLREAHSGVGEMPLALASSFLTKLGGAVTDAEGAPEPVTEAPVAATSGTDVPMMTQRWNCLSVAFLDSAEEVLPVIVSITSFASLAKLMGRFEMTQAIAIKIVEQLSSVPALYSLCMPIVATLGSGLTGSTTTSNFLFGRLQVNTAKELGLIAPRGCLFGAPPGSGAVACTRNSIYEIGAVQMFGATAGEIISPMNAVVITLMDGVGPPEGDIISLVSPLALIWMLACMAVSFIFVVPDSGFID